MGDWPVRNLAEGLAGEVTLVNSKAGSKQSSGHAEGIRGIGIGKSVCRNERERDDVLVERRRGEENRASHIYKCGEISNHVAPIRWL